MTSLLDECEPSLSPAAMSSLAPSSISSLNWMMFWSLLISLLSACLSSRSDRFEDDLAVILIEASGEVIDEIVLDRIELPANAPHPDAVLEVTLTSDGEVVALEFAAAETVDRKEQAQSRFD